MDGLILGFHLVTAHVGVPQGAHLQSLNLGVYVASATGWTAGAYRNSAGLASAYAGRTLMTADGRWALTLGVVTGYARHPVRPMLVPSVRLGLGDSAAALRVALLAKARSESAGGVHVSVELPW